MLASESPPLVSVPCAPCGAWLHAQDYQVYLHARGGGFSSWDGHLLNAWTPDNVQDGGGWYIYVRDLDTGEFWTVSGEPVADQSPGACYTLGSSACLHRQHANTDSVVDIALGHVGQATELRRLQLSNIGARVRRLEITSYFEVVLNHPDAHEAHPAFSKLFLQTEWLSAQQAWLVQRRPRSNNEHHPFLAMSLLGTQVEHWSSDRSSFLGRGRDLGAPLAMTSLAGLGRVAGNVLDPGLALRCRVYLPGSATSTLTFMLAVASRRESLLAQVASWPQLDVTGCFQTARSTDAQDHSPAPMWNALSRPLPASASLSRPSKPKLNATATTAVATHTGLRHFNGLGGFNRNGDEYLIHLKVQPDGHLRLPPMPWTNVLANPSCGVVVSETGACSMWAGNSREHRLTPWRNDAISDRHEEAWYVRDEESGSFWSALPGPANAPADYEVHHGLGYSRWQMEYRDLGHDCCMFVAEADPVRILRVRISNRSSKPQRIALYGYSRWVLGSTPESTEGRLRTHFDTELQALCAQHPGAGEFSSRVAFSALVDPGSTSWTADRCAFLGQPGSVAAPRAVGQGGPLNQALGEQACAALHTWLSLAPGEVCEVSFLMGEVPDPAALRRLIEKYRQVDAVGQALAQVSAFWRNTVAGLQIVTPVPEIDLMVNAWLPYQNLSCRLWGRTAFYQSGGAYGFRDQLQDAGSLIYLRPELCRQQILTNAAHQFAQGDVLHWWHPPLSKGMRTRFADDLLWLPLLSAYYVQATGDVSVLQEQVGFLKADQLDPDEDERYLMPQASAEQADVYEHCCRAIDRSLGVGAHGLPLFGCGDWNDGMNRVGREGRGESVWMGFFLYTVLTDFMPLCQSRADLDRLRRYASARTALCEALNSAGWDGQWYRRGWYDDGAPLGSSESDECKIDALAQAWSVLSGVATEERQAMALDALEQHLIDDGDKLIRLLTPPFVDTPHDPGYIKGYVAGVRENGGQYTHAALWVVKAMAAAGRRQRAAVLLKMLSPVHHSSTAQDVQRYQVEPYVIAADVYGAEPHIGRGGWTWYTGSAGWMYRVAVESILGFRLVGGHSLQLRPCIPDHWSGFSLNYRLPDGTHYLMEVDNPQRRSASVLAASFDGQDIPIGEAGVSVALLRDGARHILKVTLG